MKVLFLTQVLPYPLTGGAKIRAYYVLRKLSQNHRITLVSFVRPDDSQADLEHLASFCDGVHTVPMARSFWRNAGAFFLSLSSGKPAVILRDSVQAMRAMLSDTVRKEHYSVIHADQTAMAQYALFAQSRSGETRRPRTVLDQHNALYLLVDRQSAHERWPWRTVWRREARKLAGYERDLCRRFDRILTVTEEDRRSLLALLPESESKSTEERITSIPICVDPASQQVLAYSPAGRQVVHLGTMFWPPNIEGVRWFAEEVLPLVWQRIPEVRFVVAGKNPPREIQALAQVKSEGSGCVVVTGFVKDPLPLLEQSQIFVVPVRAGGGMRVKILDAWLWGLPVVSTTIGAEGLDLQPGENVLLADNPTEFASAVVQVLENPTLAERMRRAGRSWVENHYDFRKVYDQVERVYESLDG